MFLTLWQVSNHFVETFNRLPNYPHVPIIGQDQRFFVGGAGIFDPPNSWIDIILALSMSRSACVTYFPTLHHTHLSPFVGFGRVGLNGHAEQTSRSGSSIFVIFSFRPYH